MALYTVLHNQTHGSRFECIPEDFITGIGKYTAVAMVEAESLDRVYELTNSVDSSWIVNPGIVAIPNGGSQRSTSVGDVIIGDGKVWMVDRFGFKEINLQPKSFHGYMSEDGEQIVVILPEHDWDLAKAKPLDPRHDIHNHSPDGFAWGYAGSGPAQLALAICAHLVEKERAVKVYQRFKERMIATLPMDKDFTITFAEARKVLAEVEKELQR